MGRVNIVRELRGQIEFLVRLNRKLGWRDALRFRLAVLALGLGWRRDTLLRVRAPHLQHPVLLRLRSSDADVYGQVMVTQQYASLARGDVRVIVDCGANVGYASAYLLSRCPKARVVAIEPFHANAELCRRNLAPYGDRATVIEAAVWSHPTRLALDYVANDEWGVRVREARQDEQGDVDAIDLPSLGLEHIDVLKIDIEGSELELFARNVERWLPYVSTIAIELHGEACEKQFNDALSGYEFSLAQEGELTICRNITPRR